MPELLPCHRGGHRARDGRRDIDVVQRERASPAVEHLEDARAYSSVRRSAPRATTTAHSRRFGDRPLEPGVGRDVRDRERLAGRERVPGEPGRRSIETPTMSPAAGPAAARKVSRSAAGSYSATDAACASSAATATPDNAISRSSSVSGVSRSAAVMRRAIAARRASVRRGRASSACRDGHRRAAGVIGALRAPVARRRG